MEREAGNLQQLLRLSLKLSDQELREWPTNKERMMDPERQEWLKKAMEHVLENHELKKLKESLETLQEGKTDDTNEGNIRKKAEAMDDLQMLLDMDHNATDLHLLGGFRVISQYLASPVSSLQWRAAEIFAVATQNKPVCQLAAMDIGAIEQLIGLIRSSDVDMVKVKSIYALSCIVKNCQPCVSSLFKNEGIKVLASALTDGFEKVRIKAAFLLMNLTFVDEKDQPAIVQRLVSANVVPQLIQNIKEKRSDAHPHMINLLALIVSMNKEAVLQCRMPNHGLKKTLLEKRDSLNSESPEDYEDEITNYNQILNICFLGT